MIRGGARVKLFKKSARGSNKTATPRKSIVMVNSKEIRVFCGKLFLSQRIPLLITGGIDKKAKL